MRVNYDLTNDNEEVEDIQGIFDSIPDMDRVLDPCLDCNKVCNYKDANSACNNFNTITTSRLLRHNLLARNVLNQNEPEDE